MIKTKRIEGSIKDVYESSSDLYLVSETLEHSSVETTRKHYARMSEERKKAARNIVKPE